VVFEKFFHGWEHRLASVTKDRLVRPFEWGLDWIETNGHAPGAPPEAVLREWVSHALADSPRFFETPDTSDYTYRVDAGGGTGALSFPSAFETPHAENNTVRCVYFRSTRADRGHRAVVVLPQWNAGADGHVGLCRLLNRFGVSALRLSLPYHDGRKPPELNRADYIVSSNIARTVQVCRQAVMDARRAVGWLAKQGYGRIGILGTSLGSCLSLLTAAHEPRIRVQALNHISPYFADVVWRGLSTAHVRTGLDGHIGLEQLREMWMPISPQVYLDRLHDKKTLLVYAKYDLTFPVDLSESLVSDFRRRGIPHEVSVLPCGHYSTGMAPFKYLDGFVLARFLDKNL
jgi:dienelactone hydrolase